MSQYVSMSVSAEARDAFRHLTYMISAHLAERVDLSSALIAATEVAKEHMTEVVAKLPNSGK